MTSFLMIMIMVIFGGVYIYKIINAKKTYSHYPSHSKLKIIVLFSIPWIFLFFPFTFDWNAYWTLVLVRLPYTIVWFILLLIGLYLDLRLYKKHGKHNKRK